MENERILSIVKIYENLLEKEKMKDVEVLSLKGREYLKKSDIYKIVSYLMGGILSKDDMNDLKGSKEKTWKKYIDLFQKMFHLKFPSQIPIVEALFCVGFILWFENDYNNEMNEANKNRIKKKLRQADEGNGTYEHVLNYKEKNEILTYIDISLGFRFNKKYGIKIDYDFYNEGKKFMQKELENNQKALDIKCNIGISDKENFKKNQSTLKMLCEIEPYWDDIDSLLSKLRMDTALEEMRNRFIKNAKEILAESSRIFFDGLLKEVELGSIKLFDIENIEYYTEEDMRQKVIEIFDKYIEKHFEILKQEWRLNCKEFDFNPYQLINNI